MELKEVKTITDIKQGNTLIITGSEFVNQPFKAQIVKVSENDGTEVIIDKKLNKFFNVGMYLQGKSWVKKCKVVVSKDSNNRNKQIQDFAEFCKDNYSFEIPDRIIKDYEKS